MRKFLLNKCDSRRRVSSTHFFCMFDFFHTFFALEQNAFEFSLFPVRFMRSRNLYTVFPPGGYQNLISCHNVWYCLQWIRVIPYNFSFFCFLSEQAVRYFGSFVYFTSVTSLLMFLTLYGEYFVFYSIFCCYCCGYFFFVFVVLLLSTLQQTRAKKN